MVGIYLLLPSATIAVTPRAEQVGPIPLTIVADPTATQPDPARGIVPAEEISIPVAVNDTFSATGKRVELTKATGTVRFENLDPTSTNRIASGSIVRTASGVRFRTNATLTVPRAELVGLTIFPARASVKVTAVDGGPDGNVDAGTITIVPSGENSFFLKVTNPEPTSGGTQRGVQPRDPGRRRRGARGTQPVPRAGVPGGHGRPGPRGQRGDGLPLDRPSR